MDFDQTFRGIAGKHISTSPPLQAHRYRPPQTNTIFPLRIVCCTGYLFNAKFNASTPHSSVWYAAQQQEHQCRYCAEFSLSLTIESSHKIKNLTHPHLNSFRHFSSTLTHTNTPSSKFSTCSSTATPKPLSTPKLSVWKREMRLFQAGYFPFYCTTQRASQPMSLLIPNVASA